MVLDLSPDEETLRSGLSTNWRHNLKRGTKRSKVRRWDAPDPGELAAVYRVMEEYKGLTPQHDAKSLEAMIGSLGDDLLLFRADGDDGKPVAIRACVVSGGTSWDLLAAAGPAGRKSYAAYALFWETILASKAHGAARMDLGGADPDGAKGVYDFKKGTGARLVDYIGEWEAAKPSALRLAAGRLASWKAGGG